MDRTTELAEIERLKVLMAHYSTWGDTQQWDKFATLLHEDAEFIIDAAPRATPDADPVIKINGRDNYVNGMIDYTNGFHTAHQMYLPDIHHHRRGHRTRNLVPARLRQDPGRELQRLGTHAPRLRQGRRGLEDPQAAHHPNHRRGGMAVGHSTGWSATVIELARPRVRAKGHGNRNSCGCNAVRQYFNAQTAVGSDTKRRVDDRLRVPMWRLVARMCAAPRRYLVMTV
jgi:hypothetical protein